MLSSLTTVSSLISEVGLWVLGIVLGLILVAFVLAFFVHVFLTALRFFEESNFFVEWVSAMMPSRKKPSEKADD